jgi:hypothetical protein
MLNQVVHIVTGLLKALLGKRPEKILQKRVHNNKASISSQMHGWTHLTKIELVFGEVRAERI